MEGWKGGRVEGWKGGRVEGWKGGRVEGWGGLRRLMLREGAPSHAMTSEARVRGEASSGFAGGGGAEPPIIVRCFFIAGSVGC